MSDDSPHNKPLIPITGGTVLRTSLEDIASSGSKISITSSPDGLRYLFGDEHLEDAREVQVQAILSRPPKDVPADDSCMLTLRHPEDPKRLIGVILDFGKTQPEVDGVWVADDGGGKLDPGAPDDC